MKKVATVSEYIAGFSTETQIKLEKLRSVIKKTAPEAEEVISYGMPAYKQNGIVVYFAGYKNHIGFYPTAIGIKAVEDELDIYIWSKGTIQFQLNKAIPVRLIKKVVQFKVKSNAEKKILKAKKQ